MNVEQFWANVDRSAGSFACWPWMRGKGVYGRVDMNGELDGAHRMAFRLAGGIIPTGLSVLHSCDNPRCCNPRHLRAGTQSENIAEAVAKGRALLGDLNPQRRRPERTARGERVHGAKLTPALVAAILIRHRHGESNRAIARSMGVASSTVDRAIRGRTWRHLEQSTDVGDLGNVVPV